MKILNAAQIREADAYTIAHEPIASIDLMERAARTFTSWFIRQFPDTQMPVVIFAGPGNNGGDGLAVARLLHQQFYPVRVYLCRIGEQLSPDCQANLGRLPSHQAIPLTEIVNGQPFPDLPAQGVLIDALLGSGLNRPVAGYWGELIRYISGFQGFKVAIDLPSGLFADQHSTGVVFQSDFTFSFELPKLAFCFAENAGFVGQWESGSIGLNQDFIHQAKAINHFCDDPMIRPLLRRRSKFAHKGHFGHAMLICGSYGMMGAAILASRACLRAGAGLVNAHIPRCGYGIIQTNTPEVMVSIDPDDTHLTTPPDISRFAAIGVGCGLGQHPATLNALKDMLKVCSKPLVLDADALNLIAQGGIQKMIPRNSILTPHPKEFERLFGVSGNDFDRQAIQRKASADLGLFILLKGANSCLSTPQGDCYFNSTGNPGMATAGSGDVLTGVITSLLAQGYPAQEAALLGMFLHGLAGDLAATERGQDSLIAGDLIEYLGKAFLQLHR